MLYEIHVQLQLQLGSSFLKGLSLLLRWFFSLFPQWSINFVYAFVSEHKKHVQDGYYHEKAHILAGTMGVGEFAGTRGVRLMLSAALAICEIYVHDYILFKYIIQKVALLCSP